MIIILPRLPFPWPRPVFYHLTRPQSFSAVLRKRERKWRRSRQRNGSHGAKSFLHRRQISLLGTSAPPTKLNLSWLILSIENEQRRMTRRSNVALNVSYGTGRQRNHLGNGNGRRLRIWKAKSVPSNNRTGYSRNVC